MRPRVRFRWKTVYSIQFQHLLSYRENLHKILSYDWVNVPLVYVQVSFRYHFWWSMLQFQVVNLCTMLYFILQAVARQPVAVVAPVRSDYFFSEFPWWRQNSEPHKQQRHPVLRHHGVHRVFRMVEGRSSDAQPLWHGRRWFCTGLWVIFEKWPIFKF